MHIMLQGKPKKRAHVLWSVGSLLGGLPSWLWIIFENHSSITTQEHDSGVVDRHNF